MVTQQQAIDYIKKKIGGRTDFDGWYGSQCVDLIMDYIKALWGGVTHGNAIDYTRNNLPQGFKRFKKGEAVIQPGDIAVWYTSHPYGHIGVVTAVNGNLITSVEQNVDGNADALTVGGPARVISRYDTTLACFIRPPYEITTATNDRNFTHIPEKWHFTVGVDALNVRNYPATNGDVVATYSKGEVINYDCYCIANGYVWISYISRSGIRRYVATGTYTGRNNAEFGHFR